MAEALQSALEYVRTARVHLVGGLMCLSVIVENLHQNGVLTQEEVNNLKMQSEDFDKSRAILDSVIKKGEPACYEFLRIIDTTRKRTLERPPPFSEKTNFTSTQNNTVDLNYWISCFSFDEGMQIDTNYLQGNLKQIIIGLI